MRKIIESDAEKISNLMPAYRTVLSKNEREFTLDIRTLRMTKAIHLKVRETVVSITPDGVFIKAQHFEVSS